MVPEVKAGFDMTEVDQGCKSKKLKGRANAARRTSRHRP
jgi:hypothetical protein